MSEYVLAALVKCPLTPVSPSGLPTASSGVSSTDPHSQRHEAKTSAYEYDSSYLESHLLFHTMHLGRHTMSCRRVPRGAVRTCDYRHLHNRSTGPAGLLRPQQGPPAPGLHRLLWKMSAPSTKGFNLKIIINEGEKMRFAYMSPFSEKCWNLGT